MEKDFKQNLQETLKKFKRIDFKIEHEHKGHYFEVEIGNLKNEECGDIYDQLESWIGYEEFRDFLTAHDIFYNYSGWIVNENEEIVFYIVFTGPYDDEFEPITFEFEDDFIKNKLKLNLSKDFNIEDLYVHFNLEKGGDIEFKELFNLEHEISLDNNQIYLIKDYLYDLVNKNIPELNIEFDCVQNWSMECVEDTLRFEITTNPIRFAWDEIHS